MKKKQANPEAKIKETKLTDFQKALLEIKKTLPPPQVSKPKSPQKTFRKPETTKQKNENAIDDVALFNEFIAELDRTPTQDILDSKFNTKNALSNASQEMLPEDIKQRIKESILNPKQIPEPDQTWDDLKCLNYAMPGKLRKKFEQGKIKVEAVLDLHHRTQQETLEMSKQFIVRQRQMGRQRVLIITGRGIHSPGGVSVIQQVLMEWMEHTGQEHIRAFYHAPAFLGGEGALVILLKHL